MSNPSQRSGSPAVHSRSNGHTVSPSTAQPSITFSQSSASASHLASSVQYFNPVPPPYQPGGIRSLPGISGRAFLLGVTLGLCSSFTILLIYIGFVSEPSPSSSTGPEPGPNIGYLWRIPFFVATLATFHYLEFHMTAQYNTIDAKVSSFLLFNNGWAYNVAHCAAMLECLVRWLLGSRHALQPPPSPWIIRALGVDESRIGEIYLVSTILPYLPLTLGVCFIVLGQMVRSIAMKTAGTSFNHIVQATKKSDHVLKVHGVYGLSRHPSYFGFFWWGLGTQLVLGNWICLVGYGAILWQFFSHRIANEEKHLIQFFGQEYVNYRESTPVLIPFIS